MFVSVTVKAITLRNSYVHYVVMYKLLFVVVFSAYLSLVDGIIMELILLVSTLFYLLSPSRCSTDSRPPTYYAKVPSTLTRGDHIFSLPKRKSDELLYRKPHQKDLESRRISVTPDGRIFAASHLYDLAGKEITLKLDVINGQSKESRKQKVVLTIISDETHDRYRRAVEQGSITKDVPETATEINLDYSIVVTPSNGNRYYLSGAPLWLPLNVNPLTGHLVVKGSTVLDYETAPNRQYQFIVYVNDTLSNRGEYVSDILFFPPMTSSL